MKNRSLQVTRISFCAIALALAFVTSYIKLLSMPWGGAITLCSMLFIVLTGYWFGPATGLIVGFAYGILQFIQEPYILSFFQVGCDYLFAFTALGVSGFFRGKKNGLIKGYLLGVLFRGAFHALGGYLYWMDYMPENFPKDLATIYPICYNYSYLLGEAILTIIILMIPSVRKAIDRVGIMIDDYEKPH